MPQLPNNYPEYMEAIENEILGYNERAKVDAKPLEMNLTLREVADIINDMLQNNYFHTHPLQVLQLINWLMLLAISGQLPGKYLDDVFSGNYKTVLQKNFSMIG